MSSKFRTTIVSYLPPLNLLPLLFAYSIDHVAVSTYWIFFGIWLNDSLIGSDTTIKYPYLILAIVLATPAIVSIIGTSVFSSISDKIGRRKEIMLLSRLLLMTQYILLIFFGNSTLFVLIILGTFGLFTQMFYTMHSALLTTICHPDKRGQVSSFQVFFASMGWMIGSGVSGVIYNHFSIEGSLGFAAGFALFAGVISMFSPAKPWNHKELLKEEEKLLQEAEDEFPETGELSEKALTTEEQGVVNEIVESRLADEMSSEKTKSKTSYWQIFKRKEILVLLVSLAIIDFGIGPFNVVSNVYLSEVGLSDTAISVSNMCATAVGMVILLFIGKVLDKRGRKPVFLFSFLMYPLMYGLMFAFAQYPWVIFSIYMYPLYALKAPTANAIMSDVTAEDERARGMSLIQFEQIIFANTGAFLACFVADIVPQGLFITPLFPLAFGIVAVIVAFLILKETDKKLLLKRKEASEAVD